MRLSDSPALLGLLGPLALALPAEMQQKPLALPETEFNDDASTASNSENLLHGRFLWLTDLHPDPLYEVYSSTKNDGACHRDKGPAGYYGAEKTSCDSPYNLINATMDWIRDHLADKIDFVVWTGDNARHDNDVQLPRSRDQILSSNRLLAEQMVDTFGGNNDRGKKSGPKVIPSIGNNDIMPHNIFEPSPNRWTKEYLDIWWPFIPEEQRHTFHLGGYFHIEVVPNRLAVFSLNTLYFFDSNAAVNGCYEHDEPGYKQFMWLKAQLMMMRRKGMKAIVTGHVPPARVRSKQNWDESCWQMYTLWMHQFRDVIVGSLYGHMNYDHFILQDAHDLVWAGMEGDETNNASEEKHSNFGSASATDYFVELTEDWVKLPKVPKLPDDKPRHRLRTIEEHGNRITEQPLKGNTGEAGTRPETGSPWADRFSLSLVSPSVIPTFYPTIRVIEYNITGATHGPVAPMSAFPARVRDRKPEEEEDLFEHEIEELKKKKKEGKKGKKCKKPNIKLPKGPPKGASPGPGHMAQTFTFLGYTQYYANLTVLNNDFAEDERIDSSRKWKDGDFVDEQPEKIKPKPKRFEFQVEYDTRADKVYGLKDLTVRSYVDLARRVGKGAKAAGAGKARERNGKGKKDRGSRGLWMTFLRRAFVGAISDGDLKEQFNVQDEVFSDQQQLDEGMTYEL